METKTCGTCGESFETKDNYLARNSVCPDCFEFPDAHYDETPADEYDVYLVASVSAGMHGAFHAAYYRVGAKTEADARFFARAYELLEDTINEPSLSSIEFDGEHVVEHRIGAPGTTIRVMELPIVERHDGYAVTKLETRNGDDYEGQKYGAGPTTMDKLERSA